MLSEEQMCALKAAGFPFDSPRNSAWELDARLREIWDEESNGPAVDLHGNTIYHWRCRKCGYEWSRALRLEKISKGCPVCLGRALIPGWTDLQTTHPDLAKEWDQEKNDKLNGGLMPTAVVAGSAKKAWWRCGTCGGEWEAPIVKRSMGKGKCPYCAFRKLRKGVNDLESQYPEVAKDYLPELNGGVPANEVLVSNSSVVRWKCHRCGHEWTGKVTYRTTADPPTGCKPCAERERAAQQRRKAVAESGRRIPSSPPDGTGKETTGLVPTRSQRNRTSDIGSSAADAGEASAREWPRKARSAQIANASRGAGLPIRRPSRRTQHNHGRAKKRLLRGLFGFTRHYDARFRSRLIARGRFRVRDPYRAGNAAAASKGWPCPSRRPTGSRRIPLRPRLSTTSREQGRHRYGRGRCL